MNNYKCNKGHLYNETWFVPQFLIFTSYTGWGKSRFTVVYIDNNKIINR